MAGKKKTENFMKDVASEKEWESLCEYQVIYNQTNNWKPKNHSKHADTVMLILCLCKRFSSSSFPVSQA